MVKLIKSILTAISCTPALLIRFFKGPKPTVTSTRPESTVTPRLPPLCIVPPATGPLGEPASKKRFPATVQFNTEGGFCWAGVTPGHPYVIPVFLPDGYADYNAVLNIAAGTAFYFTSADGKHFFIGKKLWLWGNNQCVHIEVDKRC